MFSNKIFFDILDANVLTADSQTCLNSTLLQDWLPYVVHILYSYFMFLTFVLSNLTHTCSKGVIRYTIVLTSNWFEYDNVMY